MKATEQYFCAFYYPLRGGSYFDFALDPKVCQTKYKLLSSTSLWYTILYKVVLALECGKG